MAVTMHDSLSGTLSRLLSDRAVQERNKELARALVATGHPEPEYELVLAEGDRVTLRATVTHDGSPRGLIAEIRFDTRGEVTEYHDFLVPVRTVPSPAG
ncbi:hypothetical protein [Streptomyces sp. NPDC006739]|uniref:hypothetical protein n=1 Tax=Streptomyces sp. NPDC006739 TaxID=3364763 RepID=UPI0036C3C63E